MSSTIQIDIQVTDEAVSETLIALLSEIGFDGFEELPNLLKAFIAEVDFNNELLIEVLGSHVYTKSTIEKQNWNQLWESNFEPVQVADFVGIRASFHPPFEGVAHEIIITPKMSFGTGHHATTYLVMEAMRALDFKEKSVYDFGSGTGILAILAEKLGAEKILAVDNDDWCIENSIENIVINQCQRITIEKVSTAESNTQYEMILANINKHIIIENITYLEQALAKGGTILLSGLLVEDQSDILKLGQDLGWKHQLTTQRNGWIMLQFMS
ncbi:MAG: 50S ribosomal protein L11 methyltransferase [Bacteroidetes bacterium]|nr:50S ribosomal protein L11 methyltransferase [Bacteroidota bacterium]